MKKNGAIRRRHGGAFPKNGMVARQVIVFLSEQEQAIIERLSIARGPMGPVRISATAVVRGLIHGAIKARRARHGAPR